MKLFLKILAGFLIGLLLLIIGLNIYFTDERLKNMIVPRVSEAVGQEVQVDEMSLTFFRTFPRFGVRINGFLLPGEDGEPAASIEQLTTAIQLFPIFRNEISISSLEIERPRVHYKVFADSTSNFDFLLTKEDVTDEDAPGYTFTIPHFEIRDGSVTYSDETSDSRFDLEGLDAEIGLVFDDLLENSVEARLRSFSANVGGTQFVRDLSLELRQSSTVDLSEELMTLTSGMLSIRGLTLTLDGTFGKWSSQAPELDLQFSSASENFGELLRLAPPEFDEHLQDLETRGSLRLEGRIYGELAEGILPNFNLVAEVGDGYIKNPDLQEPIQNINFSLLADNDAVTLDPFTATAAGNRIEGTGSLERPFEEDARFAFRLTGDVDLATVSQFYPLEQAGIETLSGLLAVDAEGGGELKNPENASIGGTFRLSDGLFKYIDVPRPIEQITADLRADQNQIEIRSASFRASENRFSLTGSITEPFTEKPLFNLNADVDFDLETLKDFYPIDEDTLTVRGHLKAQAHLQGRFDPLAETLQSSNIELRNGYLDHRLVAKPLENITFMGSASATRLRIRDARFNTGENQIRLNGTVDQYLGETPDFDLNINGSATLADVSGYYSLEPWIDQLTGRAIMNLNARGPAGDPSQLTLNGSLELIDVYASGDSLALPISNLNGVMAIRPNDLTLETFSMYFGSSDITLQGRVNNYLGFLEEHESEETMPHVTGSFHSRFLNWDEMLDWEEGAEEEPIPIDLPKLTSNVTASIDTLMLFGVPITDIRGEGRTTPDRIIIDEAHARLFEGTAEGRLVWNVPEPLRTNLSFTGRLDNVQARAFFGHYAILGENSRIAQHVTAAFSADVEYSTELNRFLDPVVSTTSAQGSFGMDRARLQGHPVQEQMAQWLRADELRNLALDEWTARFSIRESVLTLNDFRLTSENIGIELNGTQHLTNDEIDFTAQLMLPSRFRSGIASVISARAVDALTRDDGIIIVPVRMTGTMGSPRISPRQTIIEDLLRDTGRDALRRLIDRVN